jgi:hypothetical protein
MPTITSIMVGDIEPDDEEADFISNAGGGTGVWQDYYITSSYEGNPHVYMMGVTSPGGFSTNLDANGNPIAATVAFVQLVSKTLLWVVDWTAARWKDKPVIPNKQSQDPNWVLLDERLEPVMETRGPDGDTPLYRISGTYVYGHLAPNTDTLRNANFPRPPWLEESNKRKLQDMPVAQGLSDVNPN